MNISQNNQINHVKKNSCVLYNNDIRKMHNKIKEKFFIQNYSSIYNKKSDNNLNRRTNHSLNNQKQSMANTKTPKFSRPYIKQLSQYCFLTLKNKRTDDNNSIPKLNESNNNFETLEKDDKKNIYFNLIKTYYDENGIKLRPQKTVIFPIDNEIDYPKIIKTKKKKKNNSLDKVKNENFLNFEKKNKSMNNNCNLYFAQIEKEKNNSKDKTCITQRKIIKRNNNINIKNKATSSGELIFRNKLQNIITSPCESEKSFNIFFQNKSGDYIINDIKNNPLINGVKDYLNKNSNNSLTNIKNNNNNISSTKVEGNDDKNMFNIVSYFNNKRNTNHKNIPIKKISEIELTPELTTYNSFNNQNFRNKTCIFHKKKISDSFDDKTIKNKKTINNKKSEDRKSSLILEHVDDFKYLRNNINHFYFNSDNNKHHNTTLSWNKISVNKINNNNNKINPKISPKRLEKYFNPNQNNKNSLPYKTNYFKTPPEIQIIDINNIALKKPFKLVKYQKIRNNTVNEVNNINNTISINNKNSKTITPSYSNNKNNSKKIINTLSQNISYNYDKQKDSSTVNNNKKKDKNNNSDVMHFYKMKYMKNKYKQNPYNFSSEKINQKQKINSYREQRKILNEYNENIININQNKYIIKSYNSKNTDINIIKEKIRKYVLPIKPLKDNSFNHYSLNNYKNNNKINEIDIKKNLIEGFISPKNKQSNVNYKITITEPSAVYSQTRVKNSIKPFADENKYINQKIIIEKEKKGNKKMYILKRKLKEGVGKYKNKNEIQNKLGIKKDNLH